ncbi:PLP-dependent aminotransferase family protein [Corticibacter populi]|uniref:PLP-dependent aminotransferase family protein n=1 Tax=Corticibacter populi TaxID=1550736 RepID=A0A3M6QPE0_9BURK|nr:PLP-dependent aminotransferase family protein [Corticibacter populi]RMX04918.1 PLP-dependent aminotransferase family protein [Corticibacter populi]RZS33657.1 GntR family transcriptional regulator [Corticibacter populi]
MPETPIPGQPQLQPTADHGVASTRVEQVMRDIRQRIEGRSLCAGKRLPSIRAQAEALGVARSTVVDAYARLVAEGVIESRPGSGFYVGRQLTPFSVAEVQPGMAPQSDPVWVTRQSLLADAASLKPGCGWLPETWMPEQDIRRALRTLSRRALAPLTGYGTPQGSPQLRQLLSHRLAERGVKAAPAQLMLTESGTQAVDLLCRFLLQPGDTVLVDDPCYFSFQAMLRAHRAEVVSVPYTPQGPDLVALAQCLAQHRPRLYLTNAALHNPTGASLSLEVAHQVLVLAAQHELTIIEDDVFADFEHHPAPRLAALDGLQRVVYVGSFSKTLSASVRVGHIATRADWISQLVDLKLATAFESGHFSAELLHTLLAGGTYQRHMNGLRARLADAMGLTIERLQRLGIQPWHRPQAGMFLWCRLPDGVDAADLSQRALLQHRMVLAPGNAFSLSQSAGSFMRFNAAQCLDPAIGRALGALLA